MSAAMSATPKRKGSIRTFGLQNGEISPGSPVTEDYKPFTGDIPVDHGSKLMTTSDVGGEVGIHNPRTPQRTVSEGLRAWSESPTSPHQRLFKREGGQEERENWDDDFLDSTDSPARPTSLTPAGTRHRGARRNRAGEDLDDENWDEDFEIRINKSGPSFRSRPSEHGHKRDSKWDPSDEEEDVFDYEMGFDHNDEEDKTVTSRSRRKPPGSFSDDRLPPLPPLPPLPTFLPPVSPGDSSGPYASPSSPFSRSSPSHSVFSIPATTTSASHRDRESAYGSTAHLALSLRRTHSAESSPNSSLQKTRINPNRFPQGSDMIPRERRRLRKKSRPPHLDSSILELDDKSSEPTFLRPSTPDSRPCTPPPLPNAATALPPTTPPSTQVSNTLSAPLSPTSASKSVLLARLGSMRRWGRKRASTTTGLQSILPGCTDQQIPSQPDATPPTAFFSRSMDAEADRFDNNKTPRPRPRSRPASPRMSPPPMTLPVLRPPGSVVASSDTRTPSRNRFFRGSSSCMDQNMSDGARPSPSIKAQDVKPSMPHELESLRVSIPRAVPMQTQSSQSGESEGGTTASPRRTRIRAFGQRFMAPRRSPSVSSAERGKDSSDGDSSRIAMRGLDHRIPSSSGTPTKLRPRLPGSRQGPSSLKVRPAAPRHFSGSAVKETGSQTPLAPSISASGRSVSASGSTGRTPSREELLHSDKSLDESPGHRGFMGSFRRISLHGSQQFQQHLVDGQARFQNSMSAAPPLPPAQSESVPTLGKSPLSASSLKESVMSPSTSAVDMIHVDLASPPFGLPSDWPSSATYRRSGDMPALTHSKSSSFATSSSLNQSVPALRLNSVTQVASLGRASPLPIDSDPSATSSASTNVNVLRRNSLGDLKIPSRISRAQDGLKRDLGRVREFAARVEQMQDLRASYFAIATQIQSILDAPRAPSRATSPTGSLFGLSRSNSRARSNTNPPTPVIDYKGLAIGFRAIDTRYSVAWECADLLIELGTGNMSEPASRYPAPGNITEIESSDWNKKRERAVTLSGDEGKPNLSQADTTSPRSPPTGSPPPLVSWRTSTIRHDLEHRQLYLLREMLTNAESIGDSRHLDVSNIVTEWTEGDEAMDSTLTLPTDESAVTNPTPETPKKRRRASRLIGIRDMLRSLKRSTARAIQNHNETAVTHSSTTINTESSLDSNPRQGGSHPPSYSTVAGFSSLADDVRRNSGTTAALSEPIHAPEEDYSLFTGKLVLSHKSSPRRPSLASLFRLGQKQKASDCSSSADPPRRNNEHSEIIPNADFEGVHADTSHETSFDDMDDSEWDRIESTSDVDIQMAATINGPSGRGHTMKLRKKQQQSRLSMPPTSLLSLKHQTLSINSSQGSFMSQDQSNKRSPRLSNVEENDTIMSSAGSSAHSGRRTPEPSCRSHSRAGRNRDREKQFSSVRTIPKKTDKGIPVFDSPPSPLPTPNPKLTMTPENIKPLLENARVVTSRLHDCLAEVKGLLLRTEGAAVALSAPAASPGMVL